MLVNKASKGTELMEFPRCVHHKASLEIILTGFKKCCIANALDSNEDDVVWGVEDACEASDNDDVSGSFDKDSACGND